MILSGQVRPGERLGERELARIIQVSRTPLREALGRLERDGLAVNRPGIGYFALEFDPGWSGRFTSSASCSRSRHARGRPAHRQTGIRELNEIMRQLSAYEQKNKPSADELREEVQLGLRIHEVIARECGNSFICETLLQIYGRLRLLAWIDFLWFDKWSLTRREHASSSRPSPRETKSGRPELPDVM